MKNLLSKILFFFKLIGKNLKSLHHKIWGKGWKRLLIAFVVTIIILLVLFTVTLNVTSKPGFCNNCHYMEPYYESWKNSTHKDVTCTDCHFPPGIKNKIKGKFTALSMVVNYITGVYKKSKPWAEISDKSCLRAGCHEERLLKGKVKFKEGIIFDHNPHLNNLRRNKKLRCTSCHSQIVQGSHLSVTETSCFLCHFKGISDGNDAIVKCTKCHMPPVKKGDEKVIYDHTEILAKNISCIKCHGKMVVGDGAVPKNRCSNCHAELHKIEKYSDTELMHKNHITDHKIECNQCHTDVQHKSVARTESVRPDCNSCHTNSHNAQLKMFTGKGGKGVEDHPSLMFSAGLNCQACHVYHELSHGFEIDSDTLTANERSCEPCHGKGYSKLLGIWKSQTDSKIRKIKKILKIAEREVKKIKDPAKKNSANKLYSDAVFNFELVKFGKSIHNISFANILLKKSYQLAKESLNARPGVSLPSFNTKHSMVPGECSNCHKKILVKTVDVFGLKFVHKRHLSHEEISCQKCHSNISKHGQLVVKKSDCMNCHHDKKMEEKCTMCHTVQADIYAGKFAGKDMNTPNIMKEDVSCSGCHFDDDSNIFRPERTVCTNCHDKDYEEMFDEWITDSANVLRSLEKKAASGNTATARRAKKMLSILKKDGSKGIHNPELYQKLDEGI